MSGLVVKVDAGAIANMAARVGAIPKKIRPAMRMAVNDTGDRTRTPMKKALVQQTGLKPKVITAAIKTDRATDATLTYRMTTRGGNIRLKYFGARETRAGVSAAPWNSRRVFGGTFIKGGRFPRRVSIAKLNGQAYRRVGSKRLPIAVARSGLFIPKEMVIGATAAAFNATTASVLPGRVAHHLGRAIGGR